MKTFKQFILEAGATSSRLSSVAQQRINSRRDFSVLPQGSPSLSVLQNLSRNAASRSSGVYPQQSSIRRGEGGAGVPTRSSDPVRISPRERGRISSTEINRRAAEKDANRRVPLTRSEVPIPVRGRPTPPPNIPGRTPRTPLTPKIRDQRRAAAGSSGPGGTPRGANLYRQNLRGVSVGDDPMDVLRSAATPPKSQSPRSNTGGSRSSSRRGGGSSLPNLGNASGTRAYDPISSRRYTPGSGRKFGLAGVGLAD